MAGEAVPTPPAPPTVSRRNSGTLTPRMGTRTPPQSRPLTGEGTPRAGRSSAGDGRSSDSLADQLQAVMRRLSGIDESSPRRAIDKGSPG